MNPFLAAFLILLAWSAVSILIALAVGACSCKPPEVPQPPL